MVRLRRGIIMGNTLSLLVAMLGLLVVLGAIGTIVYNLFYSDSAKAKKALDIVIDKIDYLKEGENAKFPLRGVDGWMFVGWSKEDLIRPDKCFLNNCVCVCKIPDDLNTWVGVLRPGQGSPSDEERIERDKMETQEKLKEACQEKEGICKAVKEIVTLSSYGEVIDKTTGASQNVYFPAIRLSNKLVELEIRMLKSSVQILNDAGVQTS